MASRKETIGDYFGKISKTKENYMKMQAGEPKEERERSQHLGRKSQIVQRRSPSPTKAAGNRQRSFPPKSDYEKFYENVFLGDTDEQNVSPPSKQRNKRPLPVEEEPKRKRGRPSKIPTIRETCDALQPKDELIRQINGRASLTRAERAKPKTFQQRRNESMNKELYTKTERHVWKKEAIQMLLQLWAQHLKSLRGSTRNCVVYREMEKQMRMFGPSHFEIKTKMDNMSRKYRVEAEKMRETGQPSSWDYFHRVQSLLIGTKCVDVFEDILFENQAPANMSPELESEDDLDSLLDDQAEQKSPQLKGSNSFDSCTKEQPPDSPLGELEDDEELEEAEEVEDVDVEDVEEVEDVEDVDDVEDGEEVDEVEEEPQDVKFLLHETESTEGDQDRGRERERTKRRLPRDYSNRLLEIEEEKLIIEREKLKVMKDALRELTAFHKDLMLLIRQK
ncbi:hypothetical protein KR018_003826 [Drosophila ironensis]|nr:hypothetical protein KR018_003826 [Drosophila ironensis]